MKKPPTKNAEATVALEPSSALNASTSLLCADFDDWSQITPPTLRRRGGSFSTLPRLPKGRHEYASFRGAERWDDGWDADLCERNVSGEGQLGSGPASTKLAERTTTRPLEVAQVVWLHALDQSHGTGPDDALDLVRCAANQPSVLEHAVVLGRSSARSSPSDPALAAAIRKIEQALDLLQGTRSYGVC